jgi:glycosyltransferase involved in cell wall biosynthesis
MERFPVEAVARDEPLDVKPHIRLLIATLGRGGSERVCLHLANLWAAEGRSVELLMVQRQGAYLEKLDDRVQISSAEATRTLRALPWLFWKLNEWRDVPVLVFGFNLGATLGAFRQLGLLRSPLIYREGSLPHRNIPRRFHWMYRRWVSGVDAFVAQSNAAFDSLCELGLRGMAGKVILNPVSLSDPAEIDDPMAMPPHGLRLLSVGRLSPEKGLIRLLGAVRQLQIESPGITLDIAGEGPQLEELQETVRKLELTGSVRFHGFVSDLRKQFDQTDLFILPSFHEGQPNALIEAILHNTRAVAAGGVAVRELLDSIGLGECIINEGDFTQELIAALNRAIALPVHRWVTARAILRKMTNVKETGTAYFEFCHQTARRKRGLAPE